MKIWNAFASNNSGSYTIVGAFESAELASEVADELLAMAIAHTAYFNSTSSGGTYPPGPSPLEALAAKYNVAATFEQDEWPEYSDEDHPSVFAIGRQVFVHSGYTITMPQSIGAIMYARGGRVSTELNHAHHPIAARFTVYFPYQLKPQLDVPALLQRFVDDVCANALALPQSPTIAPAWQAQTGFGEGDLQLGAAFEDLAPAYKAVVAAAASVGASVGIEITEAHGDPFADLRPCAPLTSAPMVDVWIAYEGEVPDDVAQAISMRRYMTRDQLRALLAAGPLCVRTNVPLSVGEQLRTELALGKTVVTLRASSACKAT